MRSERRGSSITAPCRRSPRLVAALLSSPWGHSPEWVAPSLAAASKAAAYGSRYGNVALTLTAAAGLLGAGFFFVEDRLGPLHYFSVALLKEDKQKQRIASRVASCIGWAPKEMHPSHPSMLRMAVVTDISPGALLVSDFQFRLEVIAAIEAACRVRRFPPGFFRDVMLERDPSGTYALVVEFDEASFVKWLDDEVERSRRRLNQTSRSDYLG
jgi:hypothetical protein